MKRLLVTAILCFAAPALAAQETPSAAPDMTKVGPLTRKVTNPDRQGIEALYKASDDAWMRGDLKAVLSMHDFPTVMTTDDSKGKVHTATWSREQFIEVMAPMLKDPQKDLVMRHDLTPHFLSDTLAVVIDDVTMVKGKKTLGSFKSAALVIKRDGKWLFKGGAEAGWGEMPGAETKTGNVQQ